MLSGNRRGVRIPQIRGGAGAENRVGTIRASLMSARTVQRPMNNQSAALAPSQTMEASLQTLSVIDGLVLVRRVQHPIGRSQFMRGRSTSGAWHAVPWPQAPAPPAPVT
jgi:hypothetical protein